MLKGAAEHAVKYERIAQAIGIEALVAILPVSVERIHSALDLGDHHLNGIMLSAWDKAAGRISMKGHTPGKKCPTCGRFAAPSVPWYDDHKTGHSPPWDKARSLGLSLAERVCALKHVAIHHTNYDPQEETNIA